MDSTPDVSSLIAQLKALKNHIPDDESKRKSLMEAARELVTALEAPGDTIQRIGYCYFQLAAARIASDINLFEALAEKDGSSLSTQELVRQTKTNEAFLGRLLRYLASMGMIKETREDKFSASNVTKALTIPGLKAGIYHCHDVMSPCSQALPEFLAENNYQNPHDSANSPLQRGHRTDQPPWVWLSEYPSRLAIFNLWVGASREGEKGFLDVFPFEGLCYNLKPDTPLFVDIGGGIGHQSRILKTKLPHIPGRIIVQDLPPVIAQAPATEGIELIGHDFMTEQPIKGARAYYLRNVMHDHADEKAVIILQQIIKAMDRDSVILIDDMIIPIQGAHWKATQLDLAMMSSLAAIERTERQWRMLLDIAGLRIKQICTYTPELRDSIIVAVPK